MEWSIWARGRTPPPPPPPPPGGVWWQRKAFLTFNHLIFPIVKLLPRSHHPRHVVLQFRSALCWGYHQSQKGEGHQRRWPLMSPDNNHHSAHPRCCLLVAGTGPTAWTIWTGHGLFLHQEHQFNTRKVERHISHFYFLFFFIMRIKRSDKNTGNKCVHDRKQADRLTKIKE